jgi:alkylhydroperoxidase family enzyme
VVTTTWFDSLPAGDTDWGRFAASWPVPFGALAAVVGRAWDATDPVLLELCRLRMATMLGASAELERRSGRARAAGLDETKIAELPAWPTSARYAADERACLAFAEQFVIDANGVTDEQVAELTRHLGPEGTYAFVQALSAIETFQRACLTLGIATMPDVDQLGAPEPEPSEVSTSEKGSR